MAGAFELLPRAIPVIAASQMRAHRSKHRHISVGLLHGPYGLLRLGFKIAVLNRRHILQLFGNAGRKLERRSHVHPRLRSSLERWSYEISDERNGKTEADKTG